MEAVETGLACDFSWLVTTKFHVDSSPESIDLFPIPYPNRIQVKRNASNIVPFHEFKTIVQFDNKTRKSLKYGLLPNYFYLCFDSSRESMEV